MAKATKKTSGILFEFLHDGRVAMKFLGVTDGGLTEYVMNPTDASVENQARLRALGLSNTVRDAGALSTDKKTGIPPTVEAKRDAMIARAQFILNKDNIDWTRKGSGVRDGFGDPAGLTYQALMRYWGHTDPAVTEGRLTRLMDKHGKTREEILKSFAKEPAIIRIAADIKAERAAKMAQANAESMLDDMADDDEDDDDNSAPF